MLIDFVHYSRAVAHLKIQTWRRINASVINLFCEKGKYGKAVRTPKSGPHGHVAAGIRENH